MEVLENLQPSKHLEKLSISNYGATKFPNWLIKLSSVVSLSLANCKNCQCLPSLGLLPFLEDLTITRLDRIVVIDADFYGSSYSPFASLESLHFSFMKKWEVWECIAATGAFPHLQCLSIKQCPKLKGHMPEQLLCLKKLEIHDCKQLVTSAPRAPEIHELELQHCGSMQFDYHPTALKRLTVGGQDMEASLLERIGLIISESSLEYLRIYYCPNMNISMSHCYDSLETLEILDGCDFLTTFPLDVFPKLCQLHLNQSNLKEISHGNVHSHLKDLEICGNHSFEPVNLKYQFKSSTEALFSSIGLSLPWQERSEESVNLKTQFESFPSEGLSAPCLKTLTIKRLESLKSLPKGMHVLLQSLDELHIEDCPKVELSPDGGLPSNLKRMDLSNCSKLIVSLKGALRANTSLEILSIGRVNVNSFLDEDFLPHSLTSLHIYDCPHLKKLDFKDLHHLSSLKELILHNCSSLQRLPEEGLPNSISTLRISGCQLLKERCQKPRGKDWGKIAHIENLWIG